MNIKIDISLCRVCLKQGPGTNIYTGNILEKFLFTTLVQVSKLRKILLLHTINPAAIFYINISFYSYLVCYSVPLAICFFFLCFALKSNSWMSLFEFLNAGICIFKRVDFSMLAKKCEFHFRLFLGGEKWRFVRDHLQKMFGTFANRIRF